MTEEIWKDITGYDGVYSVSNLGRVRRNFLKKEKILKQGRKGNYFGVSLSYKGKVTSRMTHRLVIEAFMGKSNLDCNHKDGIKSHNWLDNLEYCTTSENLRHAVHAGLIKNPALPQIKIDRYTLNNEYINTFASIQEAARFVKGSAGNICNCINKNNKSAYGFKWKHNNQS
jgi:hypothetical protein